LFTVIALSGPPASGKTAIKKYLGFSPVTTVTTRVPREKEVDGVDYHFKTVEEFLRLYHAGEVVEKNFFEGNFYGMHRHTLEKIKTSNFVYTIVCEANGVDFLTRYFGEEHLLPIYLNVDLETIERRLRERSLSKKDYLKRYNRAKHELSPEYMAYWGRGNGHILYNGDSVLLSETAQQIRDLIVKR